MLTLLDSIFTHLSSTLWDIKDTVLSCLITLMGGYITFREKLKENKASNKPNHYNYWGLGLMIIGVIGTIYSAWNANDDKRKSDTEKQIAENKVDSVNGMIIAKSDIIKTITQKLENKSDTLEITQQQIINVQKDELEKAEAILKKQNVVTANQNKQLDTTNFILHKLNSSIKNQVQLFKEVTGADNKPQLTVYANIQYPSDTFYTLRIWLYNHSKYPVIGSRLNIFESYAINYIPFNYEYPNKFTGDLAPGSRRVIYEGKLPILKAGGNYSYMIEVYWNRGVYTDFFNIHSQEFNDNFGLNYDHWTKLMDGKIVPPDYFKSNEDNDSN
jgi:hypothetical protein